MNLKKKICDPKVVSSTSSFYSNESLLINPSIAKSFLVNDDPEIVYGTHPIEDGATQHV
jgi:hypothetical protein